MKSPEPDGLSLQEVAAVAQEDQLVVRRVHLRGRRPVEDDVGDAVAQEPVELLDLVLVGAIRVVLHEDHAVAVLL